MSEIFEQEWDVLRGGGKPEPEVDREREQREHRPDLEESDPDDASRSVDEEADRSS